MLSIGKIGLNGEGYYVAAVADGIGEYYRGVGEAPGRWSGTASAPLGLNGEVDADDLHAVWSGLNPSTGEPRGRFAGRTVAGFDLCFRAPKSVLVLSGLGDRTRPPRCGRPTTRRWLRRSAMWSRRRLGHGSAATGSPRSR